MIETCAMSERTNTGHFFAYSPPSSMTWLIQPSLLCHCFSTLICACKFASLSLCRLGLVHSPFPTLYLHMPKRCSTLDTCLLPQTKYLQCHKVSHQNIT